ncbi:MAG: hypothetical protein RR584_12685, partial [Comamonas sp.]
TVSIPVQLDLAAALPLAQYFDAAIKAELPPGQPHDPMVLMPLLLTIVGMLAAKWGLAFPEEKAKEVFSIAIISNELMHAALTSQPTITHPAPSNVQ